MARRNGPLKIDLCDGSFFTGKNNNFEVVKMGPSKITLKTKRPLPGNIWVDQSYHQLILEAKVGTNVTGNTLVTVLPQSPGRIMRHWQSTYRTNLVY